MKNDFAPLLGKTITKAHRARVKGKDDTGWLILVFSDGTRAVVEASYGGYTGESYDEYPTRIDLCAKRPKGLRRYV